MDQGPVAEARHRLAVGSSQGRPPVSHESAPMAYAIDPYAVVGRVAHGETRWVAIRALGAKWPWLTPEEASAVGRKWLEPYGSSAEPPRAAAADHIGRLWMLANP